LRDDLKGAVMFLFVLSLPKDKAETTSHGYEIFASAKILLTKFSQANTLKLF